MATTPNTKDEASNTIKVVDSSLWWDSFSVLLTELENISLSSDITSSLERKLKENHPWFLDAKSLFKPPNQKSREALDASAVKIDSRQITIRPELKETALKISSILSYAALRSDIQLIC
nr:nuclear pore complex protein Nup188 [Ipomoea batatas]